MGQDITQTEGRGGSPDITAGGRGPTARVAQPDEFFPLASEEMIRRGEISDAVEHCRRGLIFYPDNISGYAVLANAYLLLDEPTRAANVLRDGHRRTRAERLLELADAIEREAEAASSQQPTDAASIGSARRADRKPTTEEVVARSASAPYHVRGDDREGDEERPLIPTEIEDDLSPTEELSHTDAEETAVAESAEAKEEQTGEDAPTADENPEELSFISDDPAGASWSVSREENEELNPYVSDERDDEDYDEDVTERLIVRGDASLFGNEVRPTNQDLFTGEPLPTDESFLQESDDDAREEEKAESDGSDPDLEEGRVDLNSPVEDIIVPAPDPGSTLHEESVEAGEQLIPMPERGDRGEFSIEGEKKKEREKKEEERKEEATEDRSEEPPAVTRPMDPTAGMAAGADRGEGGDLADLIDEGKSRDPDEEEPTPSPGLSLHSGTQISDLRSRNLRLIPGLEYAPLRKDDTSLKIAPLVDKENRSSADISGMPPLGGERTRTPLSPEEEGGADPDKEEAGRSEESGSMTPLEELARRLETARIPAVEEEPEEEEEPHFEPSLVSDTFAGILVSQGAYSEAIKAYQMLARLKPDRRDEYEKKIAEIHWKMDNVTDE